MSDVNAKDTTRINGEDDVWHLYQGVGAGNAKTGIEVEMGFFDPASPTLKTMSVAQNKVVKNAAAAAHPGNWVNNEPSSETLEVSSIAGGPDDLRAVMDDTNKKIRILTEKAAGVGLKRSYFQELPEKPYTYLLENLMDVPRYQAFFGPPRADMQGFAAYFTVCKSTQVSVSYENPDQLLGHIRRLYLLAPFLFLITDNSSGFAEGKRFKGHSGMYYRHIGLLEGRGGVPPYIFTAQNGEAFIRAHINHVMNNPLYVYYDENGDMQRVPAGQWTSFNELRERGLNTATNYYFAQTVLWPDVKVAALRDANDNIFGHRYEARMLGVGAHQHQTSQLIVGALAFNPEFAAGVDRLLAEYGLDLSDSACTAHVLEESYNAARNHGGKYLNVTYGAGVMADFAREFADLIEKAYVGQGFDDELLPLLTICRTGCTDAKVNARLFPTLDEALDFQRSYDPAILENPNICAKLLFEKELKSTGADCHQSAQF